ncbi:MAG: helix-turn-helix domain-containing protein [Arachidicoccus sp.]|nr:helix-turn-helix domain-containing protein [Arachidicoccus sp.]
MEKKLEKYADCPRCPIRNVLDRIGDKWSMLVISVLGEVEKMRFSEIQKVIPDISQKMLTVTLKTLEADGLVSRKVFAEVPPKVEYKITERGKTLLPHINNLTVWAAENMTAIKKSRVKFERK